MSDAVVLTPYLAGATSADLEDWGALEEATGAEMMTAGVTLWEDGDASAGVWECSPGPSYWTLTTNEVIHLVAGRMTVQPDGGQAVEMGAGDVAVFPSGWAGVWTIHETVRKVYAIF
jgi:uncharacterized cupin superfamily protein